MPGAGGTARPARERWSARWILGTLLLAVALVALIRAFLLQSFVIPSGSMEPTLDVGDRVLVSRVDRDDLRRGDVVVFDGTGVFDPEAGPARSTLAGIGRGIASALGVPVGSKDYVKRIVGLPGDRVVCCDAQQRITVNGTPLTEPYLAPGDTPSATRFDIQVPAGRLWVMGDHRSDSADSRAHLGDPGGGTVPLQNVVGRVVAVWWPLGSAGGVGRVDPLAASTAPSGTRQEATP